MERAGNAGYSSGPPLHGRVPATGTSKGFERTLDRASPGGLALLLSSTSASVDDFSLSPGLLFVLVLVSGTSHFFAMASSHHPAGTPFTVGRATACSEGADAAAGRIGPRLPQRSNSVADRLANHASLPFSVAMTSDGTPHGTHAGASADWSRGFALQVDVVPAQPGLSCAGGGSGRSRPSGWRG